MFETWQVEFGSRKNRLLPERKKMVFRLTRRFSVYTHVGFTFTALSDIILETYKHYLRIFDKIIRLIETAPNSHV